MEKPSLSFYTNIPTPYMISFFRELSRHFKLRVIYYSNSESNRTWNFDLQEDYDVVFLKNNFIAKAVQKKVLDFHFSWGIFKEVRENKSDYVIVGPSYWLPNAVVALIAGKRHSKKVAYFSEPLFSVAKDTMKYRVKWLMLRILSISCDAIFAIGKKAAKSFKDFGVNLPSFIIPYNINSKEFSMLDKDKLAQFNQKYKPNGELIMISSGSLIKRKGMDVVINAMKTVDNPNLKFLILGGGSEEAELRALAGDDKRIVFAGFQQPEGIPYFFGIADIFVFASRYDGWAVVLNEAIAAGVPIICSDAVGAGIELIDDGRNGFLCPSEDVAAFSRAINKLANSEAERQRVITEANKSLPLVSSDYYAEEVYKIFTSKLN